MGQSEMIRSVPISVPISCWCWFGLDVGRQRGLRQRLPIYSYHVIGIGPRSDSQSINPFIVDIDSTDLDNDPFWIREELIMYGGMIHNLFVNRCCSYNGDSQRKMDCMELTAHIVGFDMWFNHK
jgi:hypothetical protein